MWETKIFKSADKMRAWIEKHGHKFQWYEIFINNGYAVECKPLRVIDWGED